MTDKQKAALKRLKTAATKREQSRVFDNMNMPPRSIEVEYMGHLYIRTTWQNPSGAFGWDRWEMLH